MNPLFFVEHEFVCADTTTERITFDAEGRPFGGFCRNSPKIVTDFTAGNDFNDFIVSDFTKRLYNSDGYDEGLYR